MEQVVPRLNVLDLQMQIRRIPKPVIAMVAGWAIGGGHVLREPMQQREQMRRNLEWFEKWIGKE